MIISTKAELRDACRTFAGDEAIFRHIVEQYLALWGVFQRDLAEKLGMAESTIARWLSGVTRPHPAYQAMVVARIAEATREPSTPEKRFVKYKAHPERVRKLKKLKLFDQATAKHAKAGKRKASA